MPDITLAEYAKRFKGAVDDFDLFCKTFVVSQGLDIEDQAAERSPVNTGALKASWRTGGKLNKSATISNVTKKGRDYQITISNGMEYSSYLEYGTKKGIKPYNMLSVPIERYKRTVAIRFSGAFVDYLKKKGIG